MEPTTIAIGLAGIAGKDIINKLLGPTADYLGQNLQQFVERQHKNIGAVFANAAKKLGSRIEQPGTVPPRVLKAIISEGAFCEDAMATEYFGGILASSRSADSADDRGVVYASIVSRMSVSQIRSHYIIYSSLATEYSGCEFGPNSAEERFRLRSYVSCLDFAEAMKIEDEASLNKLLPYVLAGLVREHLITDYDLGPASHLAKLYPGVDLSGIVFSPTVIGTELFLWAHGMGEAATKEIFSLDTRNRDPNLPRPIRLFSLPDLAMRVQP